ncbi:hypothetical protein HOF92_03190, partial [bacterium]|nr:hypothetical protein [bacterium]
MKIGFLSSVEVGYQTLKLLYEDSVEISLVLSLHPEMAAKTSGFMNFEKIARENGSIHYKVKNINSSRSQSILEKSSLDLLIVCGFQRLLKEPILSIPRLG